MKYLVTGKEMKLLDQNTSTCFKVPELVLMEQAAMHFVWELCNILPNFKQKKGIVFCGLGNNGADGIAAARLLNERGISTQICKIKDVLKEEKKTSDSFQVQESIYRAYDYPVLTDLDSIKDTDYDFVIDAVFGIGLSRELNEEYSSLLQRINAMDVPKIAIDMPSGINSDNGQIMGAAVLCDYTITFSFAKLGQYLWPGSDYAGKVIVTDMGITQRSWMDKKPSYACLEERDLLKLPKRTSHSNKGTYGKLLIAAGSKDMCGAAIFAAKAAYRSGVGLVKIFTSEENRTVLQISVPEALVTTYKTELDREELLSHMKWADAILVGPGLGQSELSKEIVAFIHETADIPVIWDADALNIFSQNIQTLKSVHSEYIMTPHLGEFSRLTGSNIKQIQSNLVNMAKEFAETYHVICVLKDFHSITAVPSGLSYLNLSGNHGMATGGSGDVLAGIIGALLAQGLQGEHAAAFGTYIHGLAGDAAKTKIGTHAMTASDIIESLYEVWKGMDDAEYQSLCRD